MNGRLEPYQLAEIHRHLDDRDAQYDRMQAVSVDDVLEAMPEADITEVGNWILEAIGKALDMRDYEGNRLIQQAIEKARGEYMKTLKEIA